MHFIMTFSYMHIMYFGHKSKKGKKKEVVYTKVGTTPNSPSAALLPSYSILLSLACMVC
jgi:hypothetical protein